MMATTHDDWRIEWIGLFQHRAVCLCGWRGSRRWGLLSLRSLQADWEDHVRGDLCLGSGKPYTKDPTGFLIASGYCVECREWVLDDPPGSEIAELHENLCRVIRR
jgi:hypothetical protein